MNALISLLLLFQLLLVLIGLGIIVYILYVLISFNKTLPFVPTPRSITKKMAKLATIPEKATIYDLGSGSGALMAAFAKKYPDSTIIGYEISPILITISKLKFFLLGFHKQCKVKKQDLFTVDLSEVDAVVVFPIFSIMEKLKPQLDEMKTGAQFISYMFPLNNSSGFTEETFPADRKWKIFIYTKLA